MTPTPFTIEDLYRLPWIEDVRISPDGCLLAYVVVTVDRLRNTYRRAIYLLSLQASISRRFTMGTRQDTTPRWSPDSKRLAFVSTRDDERGQIYLIDVDGGEGTQLTTSPYGASEPAWSPDGRSIAFLAHCNEEERTREDQGDPAPAPNDEWEARRLREQRQREDDLRTDPRVITRLPYRTGTSFFDDRRRHIYLIEVPVSAGDEAPPARRLTAGDIHYGTPVWLPDGKAILSTASRDPEADSLFAYNDVLRIPINGGKPEILTHTGFSYASPRPSPDGRFIAFQRVPEDRLLAAGNRIAILPAAGGEPYDLTAHTDLDIEDFRWLPDSQGLAFVAGWQGDAHVYAISLAGTTTQPQGQPLVAGRRMILAFDVDRTGTIAFAASSAENPCELFVRHTDGTERQLTTPLLILHSELDYRVPLSEAEQLFAILRRQKKVVELVRYPREGHELTRVGEPRHRVDHMTRTFTWFDRYCKPMECPIIGGFIL